MAHIMVSTVRLGLSVCAGVIRKRRLFGSAVSNELKVEPKVRTQTRVPSPYKRQW
jgi:hypothetical protein